jgi:hypothetical protein
MNNDPIASPSESVETSQFAITLYFVIYDNQPNPCFVSLDKEDAVDFMETAQEGCIANDPELYRVEERHMVAIAPSAAPVEKTDGEK